ncbi:MAG: site-2 protease family protein [Nitriliruptorales bacterium]
MLKNAVRIGAIRGVDIRLDPSWFVLALLFLGAFWGQFTTRYGHAPAVAGLLALVTTLLFFASVLAHELAHALEAMHHGVHVGGITLFLFGGVTETRFDVRRPADEFALSAVGPWSSFVLAAVFGLLATGAHELDLRAAANVTGLLGWINLVLGVFNLLPGAPLDGGRVLRSALWRLSGDRERAVRLSARAGQALGLLIVIVAVYQATVLRGLAEGLFNAFIGWFLFRAASAEHAHADVARLLADLDVGSFADRERRPLPAHTPARETLGLFGRNGSDVRAVEREGATVGIVRGRDLRKASRDRRSQLLLEHVMTPIDDVPTVRADVPMAEALDALLEAAVVVVVDDGGPVSLLTPADVDAAVERLRAMGRSQPATGETT